ncbi:MAG: sugar ABC transporter substrate-binding protein [Myxococcota bacterium]
MKLRIGLVVVSCILSVLTGLVLARGGSRATGDPSANETVRIGFSLDTLKEARWQMDRDLFVARARRLGARVLVQSANSDDATQISDVEKLLTAGVDVLVIVPHDGTAMAKGVRMANEAGVPVIAYDRIVRDVDLDLYVSFDNVRVGELQARYVVDALGGRGRIVRILGSRTDHNAFRYKEGQDRVLGPYIERGAIEVVHEDWADDWKPETAKKIVNAAITAHGAGGFDAVLASNDGTAGGAIQALAEEGLAGKKIVTGQDAELVACQRVVRGTQSMTIYKPLATLAETAADAAVKLVRGGVVVADRRVDNGHQEVPAVLTDVVTVTSENLLDAVVASGFHPYDAVYRGIPEADRPPRPRAGPRSSEARARGASQGAPSDATRVAGE